MKFKNTTDGFVLLQEYVSGDGYIYAPPMGPAEEAVMTIVRNSVQHPEIEQVMQPVAMALNNDEMIELGKKVDVDGEDPGIVARDWMIEKGFIGPDTS